MVNNKAIVMHYDCNASVDFYFLQFSFEFYFLFLLSNNAAGNYRLFKQRKRIRQQRFSSVNHNSKKKLYARSKMMMRHATIQQKVECEEKGWILRSIHVCHYYIDDYAFFCLLVFLFCCQHLNSNELWHSALILVVENCVVLSEKEKKEAEKQKRTEKRLRRANNGVKGTKAFV